MAPIFCFLISSGSKKKEPTCVCQSEGKASHSHKMCTEVSSSVPHFLKVGLLRSPILYKCLLKVLCPVSRLITTLDCALLKDNNRALVARSGPEINSRACLCVLQGPHHFTKCQFSIQPFIFLLTFCLETPKKGSGPANVGNTDINQTIPLSVEFHCANFHETYFHSVCFCTQILLQISPKLSNKRRKCRQTSIYALN